LPEWQQYVFVLPPSVLLAIVLVQISKQAELKSMTFIPRWFHFVEYEPKTGPLQRFFGCENQW
jgi:hypothetical protein